MVDNKLQSDPYAVFKIRDYRFFLSARFAAVLGVQVQGVAVGWQVYELTKDPLSLGLVGLSEAVPALSVALYAGYVVDRANRKTLLMASLIALLFCSLALLGFAAYPSVTETFGALAIYAVVFLSGIARGFLSPAMFSLAAQLVPRPLYANMASWNSASFEIASILGPALGGLMYGTLGARGAYTLDVALMAFSIVALAFVLSPPTPTPKEDESALQSILAGARFIFNNQVILGALSLDMFAVLFGGAVALLPVYASEILNVGPEGLGLLRAAPSVGAALTAFVVAHRPFGDNAGKALFISVAGFGLCIIGFGVSTNFYLSLAMLAASGMFDSVSVIIRSTILQMLTPDDMRGRVSAVNTMFIGSSNELGAFESGVAAKLLGVVPSVIFGGSVTLLVVAIVAGLAPKLRQLSFLEPAQSEAQ